MMCYVMFFSFVKALLSLLWLFVVTVILSGATCVDVVVAVVVCGCVVAGVADVVVTLL